LGRVQGYKRTLSCDLSLSDGNNGYVRVSYDAQNPQKPPEAITKVLATAQPQTHVV
jgi:hypothetical protein